mgnify:CR=1 FL=1
MSYTYLQEQGEESSAECYSDIPQFALLRSKNIPAKSCSKDSATESCHGSQSGTTSPPLTATRGEGESMSSAADSPAKTSAQPGKAPESPESEADSGERWQGSFAKFDHDSSLWRTHQCSLLGGWEPFSETWPRWGLMRDGACWERTMSAHLTSGTGSGLLPTPLTSDHRINEKQPSSLARKSPQLGAVVANLPTPTSRDWKGAYSEKSQKKKFRNLLPDAAKRLQYATPQASDNRDRGHLGSGAIQRRMKKGKQIMLSQSVSDQCGALNPPWVEWLMAWPIGWTDLKPLETGRWQAWRLSHGKS